MKILLSLVLVIFFSMQLIGQTSKSKFMRNKIVSSYPQYTFENESSTALLIVDGKITDYNDLSKISRHQFCALTYIDSETNNYVNKYGDVAKNGVFEINTKNHLAKEWLTDIIPIDNSYKLKQMVSSKSFDHSRLMIVVNGRELTTDFYDEPKIDAKSISSINLESFKGIYGAMLTIETKESDLNNNDNIEKVGITTASAVGTIASVDNNKSSIVPTSTKLEVKLPSKTSQTIIGIVAVTPVVIESSTPTNTETPKSTVAKPIAEKKVENNNVYAFQAVDVMATFSTCNSESDSQAKYICFQKMLMNHVIKNFKYPEEALKHGVQGRVIVKFVIQKDGSIGDISVLRGVSEELDNEAIRIVTKIPNINPALINGENVKVYTTLPITFKLR